MTHSRSGLSCAIAISAAVLFVACAHARAPIYSTTYAYAPPTDESGRACVAQAEANRTQCENLARERQSLCGQRSEQNFAACNTRADSDLRTCQATPGRVCIRQVCMRETCGVDSAPCVDAYNRGYATCGGTVTPSTVCERNCGAQ